MDDSALLRRAAAGDDEAFAVFYRRHLDEVVAYLRRRVAEPELAFDLTAETFAAAVVGAASWRGEGDPVAWLYGIARNKWRESVRRGRVEDAARLRLRLEPLELEDADLLAVEVRADAGAERLDAWLAELPEPTRRAVVGRVVEERGYGEIAAELACSEQVVRQRVSRGLAALRARIEEEGEA
ncbi:RNA polymerase sigma factor YlaC [Baekduia alba]|uniref:RNA polymerase sigma factor n=1 Tax=Baekduia alba TaxID=2997333 RepID=UPI00234241B2|nr:RNA polymerase sigma factor [Baekduia alba]WCB96641.1 RNA polymerase sigma factor YlaC [Baekduia alba]